MAKARRTSSTLAFGTLPMRLPVYGLQTSIVRSPLRSPPTFSPAMRISSCMNIESVDMIQDEVEGVEVAPSAIRVDAGKAPVDDQRHPLLGSASVRAQRHLERREVVPRRRGANHLRALGDDDEVADAVSRQLEEGGRFFARADRLDAAQRRDARRERRHV